MKPTVYVPEALEAGTFADSLVIWREAHCLTLDFQASLPGEEPQPCRKVVARVKFPPAIGDQLLRALSAALDEYEKHNGSRHVSVHLTGDNGNG